MQSDLDSLTAAFDLSLRDCATLIKTGVLGAAISSPSSSCVSSESEFTGHGNNVSDLLSRLQIGDLKSKHRPLAYLVEEMKIYDKCVVDAVGRNHIPPLVQLLTATSQRIREKTVTLIASLVESGSCKNCLVAEGVIPLLIKLVESDTAFAKQKAVISLQRLSVSSDVARAIMGHGGIRPLIDVCRIADPVTQFAAAGTLRNVPAVPDTRHTIAEEGVVGVMMYLLDSGILIRSKERAVECLQHLTISNNSLRRSVISEGGVCRLLTFLDSPLPHEFAVATLRNLVSAVPTDKLVLVGFLPCMVHVLKCGSLGAQHAAASALCRVISTEEMKKLVGEVGCIPRLISLLSAKTNAFRKVAAQAISNLMTMVDNFREVKKYEKSIPNLVQLLDPSPYNTAKKHAVSCLHVLSSSKNCKKLMISYGAIECLKKLVELDTPGAKKLLERLVRSKLRSLVTCK